MLGYSVMLMAATPTIAIVRSIGDDQLTAPTPCTEFDVRGLMDHLLHWAPPLEGAARKELVPPRDGGGGNSAGPGDDERVVLVDQIDRIAKAWSEPSAWEGTTRMGSPTELPASMIGGMVLGEIVVHGWDLARATGQASEWDGEVLSFVHRELELTAEQGRAMGVYRDRVEVPDTASVLDKILGMTGRDPGWTASQPDEGRRHPCRSSPEGVSLSDRAFGRRPGPIGPAPQGEPMTDRGAPGRPVVVP